MNHSLIVVDNFLHDPDATRANALELDYSVTGPFPGRRAPTLHHPRMRSAVQALLPLPLLHWPNVVGTELDGANGMFQYSTEADQTWIHADAFSLEINGIAEPATTWGGVLYLSPNAPTSSGTRFFRHRETGATSSADDEQPPQSANSHADSPEFEQIDEVANVYNRLVLFDGRRFHCAGPGFGSDVHTGRLFRVLFFATV